MYIIKHVNKNIRITANSFEECQRDYYYQFREQDGSIPWEMFYLPSFDGIMIHVDPVTGTML